MKRSSALEIFVAVLLLLLAGTALYTKLKMNLNNSIVGPIGAVSQQLTKNRYQQGKIIRIIFKDDITDYQAQSLMKEWQQLPDVNGASFTSAKVAGRPIVDLFIVNTVNKTQVIQTIQQNPAVVKTIDKIE